jgi:phenylacetate-CoA ligase
MRSLYLDNCHAALDQALAKAPFYQAWRSFDRGPAVPVKQRFAALPFTTKRDLRSHMPHGFTHRPAELKAALASGDVELVSTSGTTEDRSSVLWHQPWWDASEHAAASLHAGLAEVVARAPREAVLTSPLCGATVCHVGDLTMSERTLGRLLFLNQQPSPAHWTTADCDRMIAELNRFTPEILEADPAYLAILAHHAVTNNRHMHAPAFITLTYEFPSRVHLRQIHRAFPGVPVVSSYGSTETGHVLTACEHGNFHQNTASCHLDFQPLQSAHGQPQTGRILVTVLNHPWLSLVRFEPGDLVRLSEQPCACGRHAGLTVAAIAGRTRDLTFTTTGKAVTVDQLDAAVGAIENLLAYQIEQENRANYIFRFVAETDDSARVQTATVEALTQLYGSDACITVRRESAIAPEASGKFRLARLLWSLQNEPLFDTAQENTP